MNKSISVAKSLVLAGFFSAVISTVVFVNTAQAQQPANLYSCKDNNSQKSSVQLPPVLSTPSTLNKASMPASASKDEMLCPGKQVVVPQNITGPKAPLQPQSRINSDKSDKNTSRFSAYGYNYSHSVGTQYVTNAGVSNYFVDMTVHNPFVQPNTGASHSLGQLWYVDDTDPRGNSTVEVGWKVSPGQFRGDKRAHLFVYRFDAGQPVGFAPAGGWVQVSKTYFPNMVIPNTNSPRRFGVMNYNGNMWVYYNNEWIGYYPGTSYTRHFPSNVTRLLAGGETSTVERYTCTDMGVWQKGTDPNAAKVYQAWYGTPTGSYWSNFTAYNSDPMYYVTGNWVGSYSFRYGGAGWC